MKASSFSSQTAQEIDLEVRKIILEAEKNTHKIISENRELLELIKDALILNETIVAEEIEYIDKNMKLPPKLNDEKQELSKDYPKADFDTLFNEVSGKKIISEDKYKKELDKKIKDLDKETKKSNNKNSSSKENKEKPNDQNNKEN
jgi:ATP-dependent zinc metalloprotease ftsH